jgi:hypothetical protein
MSIAIGIRSNDVVIRPEGTVRETFREVSLPLRWMLTPEGAALAAWLTLIVTLLSHVDR